MLQNIEVGDVKAFAGSSQWPHIVYTCKSSFQIVYANSAMSSTTQYTQEQMAGKSLAELEA
jgi:PAS domain-containing protein